LLLSGNVLNEKIKAVLFFNHEQFNSNIIEFENGNPSSSITNLDALKALYITHGEDSREVY
jgi:hypothetical protein